MPPAAGAAGRRALQLRPAHAAATARVTAGMNIGQQRPLDPHRVVEARRNLARRVHVVDDVDAADKGDPRVDHRDLAVQPAQALALAASTAKYPAGT